MQSENFDKKIKDSLSQRPPENETPQWDKMEPLLDKHMPVEKDDRRRIFFILFLFLLLGGGAFFIWKNNGGKNDIAGSVTKKENTPTINTEENKQPVNEKGKENKPITSSSNETNKPVSKDNIRIQSTNTQQPLGKEIEVDASGKIVNNKKKVNIPVANKIIVKTQKPVKQPDDVLAKRSENEKPITNEITNTNSEIIKEQQEKNKETEIIKPIDEIKPAEQKIAENKTEEQQSKPQESQPILTANSKSKKQKGKSSLFSNLFFTVSAGPDFSTVGLNKSGKIEPVIGAGIGYQFSKRFSVRTGFYTARKVYNANPEDYHPPANFWAYYPNLKNIEANCKVYEIPVTIDYTFSQNKKQSWFVSAGLSSLLMKEETYEYYYKPNSSPTYVSYTRTIKNENNHYFSVLNFSGGYTRNINKNFSLRAEPYAKFALGGVGYGKVKLNSGGVLFSAIIKPFARK